MRSQKINEIKKALEDALSKGEESDVAIEKVMQALDTKKILRYHQEHEVSLLSTSGRVLISIMQDQEMTIRAISVYLDLSETMIDKTLKSLINAGLITKTKVNRQNVYRCNKKLITNQPDIRNLLSAITEMNKDSTRLEVAEDEVF